MRETILRHWLMLQAIRREPARTSTSEICAYLRGEGYTVSERTVQRDLRQLQDLFPLECDTAEKPYRWFWPRYSPPFDVPGLDTHMALVFHLAHAYLQHLLPPETLANLEPYLRVAEKRLDAGSNPYGTWRERVRVLPSGPPLATPHVDAAVERVLYESLLRRVRVRTTYRSRARNEAIEAELSALGLIYRAGVVYVVAQVYGYDDVRLFALQRFTSAELTPLPATEPQGFDLDDYIRSGALDFSQGRRIRLRFRITAEAGRHLAERPLSDDQKIRQGDDGWQTVSATVPDSIELRWWLRGFGPQVEVLAPAKLRREFVADAKALVSLYR